jgi:hypothetical protein
LFCFFCLFAWSPWWQKKETQRKYINVTNQRKLFVDMFMCINLYFSIFSCCRCASCQGLQILSCEEAIQLAYRKLVILFECPLCSWIGYIIPKVAKIDHWIDTKTWNGKLKVMSLCHQDSARPPCTFCAVWPGSTLLADQL